MWPPRDHHVTTMCLSLQMLCLFVCLYQPRFNYVLRLCFDFLKFIKIKHYINHGAQTVFTPDLGSFHGWFQSIVNCVVVFCCPHPWCRCNHVMLCHISLSHIQVHDNVSFQSPACPWLRSTWETATAFTRRRGHPGEWGLLIVMVD